MKLKIGNYLLPFWGAPDYLTRGRDSLGLQTASQATYARLIPIITNLTTRIRYFGFYPWLLEEYAKQVGDTNPEVQKRFIRRAELLIAFMMVKCRPDAQSIPGSNYASTHLETDYIDIKEGADIEPHRQTVYWQLSSGAFGQYYVAALQLAGLITYSKNAPEIFIPTEKSGRPLAQAFDKNLSDKAKTLFWHSITNGKIKKDDLDILIDSFSISDIPLDSEEHGYYLNLLKCVDVPLDLGDIGQMAVDTNLTNTYFRKATTEIILKFIKNHYKEWTNFKVDLYSKKGDFSANEDKDVAFGWYYYQMNEFWHYAVETIFWAMLFLMDTRPDQYNQIPIDRFIKYYSEEVHVELKRQLKIKDSSFSLSDNVFNETTLDEVDLVAAIDSELNSRNPLEASALGFRLLLMVWIRNKGLITDMEKYVLNYNVSRQGDILEGLKWIETYSNNTLNVFISDIIKRYLINRHLEVAYEKMGSGTKNTLKFSIEHNLISHLETIEPAFTTPRIYSLYQIMMDIDLIKTDGKITKRGIEFIE